MASGGPVFCFRRRPQESTGSGSMLDLRRGIPPCSLPRACLRRQRNRRTRCMGGLFTFMVTTWTTTDHSTVKFNK